MPTILGMLIAIAYCGVLSATGATKTQWYSPAEDTLLWIHVPKCGGSALARVAHEAASQQGGTIAWCYQRGGAPACSQPSGTLAMAPDLQHAAYRNRFLPEEDLASSERQPPSMVYGHGVKYGTGLKWGLKGRHRYIIMLRHPLSRFFSAHQQMQRDKRSVHHGQPLEMLAEYCANRSSLPGGGLQEYLVSAGDIAPELQFNTALAALQSNSTLVLIQERWDDSMRLLRGTGVLNNQHQPHQHNVSPKRARVNVNYGHIGTIIRCIQSEEALYYTGLAAFERALEKFTSRGD